MEKKDIKKVLKVQQEIANETLAYESLTEILTDASFINPIRRMIEERKKHLRILETITGTEVVPKDSDVKYVKRIYKIFGTKRLFSNLETVMKEKGKDTASLMKTYPSVKEIHQAESRYQTTFHKLAALEKKKQKLQ